MKRGTSKGLTKVGFPKGAFLVFRWHDMLVERGTPLGGLPGLHPWWRC